MAPDLIIFNGAIHTMDAAQPVAEAVAIQEHRILAVGSDQQIRALAGPNTHSLDAEQGTVLPGFNDAHVHFLAGGFSLSNVDLREATSPADLAGRLAQYVRDIPKGRWIQGGDWDHENWRNARDEASHGRRGGILPTRQLIDSVTPDHPVLITRLDGHMALANGLALKLAGVGAVTEDPPGGLMMRDLKTGQLTGILKDSAQQLVERVIPPKTRAEKERAARAATQHAAALGGIIYLANAQHWETW